MSGKLRIIHLDGLRGIAILWVILFHSYCRWAGLLEFPKITKDVILFKYGFLGVELFFMISGFVIFMTLDKSPNFIDYIKRRWLRLFPAMLIVSVIIFSTASFFYERPSGQPTLLDLIPGLTFIKPSFLSILFRQPVEGLEGTFWSLYVEVIFYFIMGLTYFLLGRKFCISALFLLLTISTMTFFGVHVGLIPKALAIVIDSLGFWHYGWFIIGCIVYEQIHGRSSNLLYVIGLLSIIMTLIRLPFEQNYAWLQDQGINWQFLLINIAIIALFIASFCSEKLQRLLSLKFLLLIGFVSYPLYLIHENILVSSLLKLQKSGIEQNIMLAMPVLIVAILIGISYLIAKFVEPYLRQRLKPLILK